MRKTVVLAVLVVAVVVLARWSASSAPRSQVAATEKLKQTEAEFLQAALDHGSAGYMSYYADDAAELPNGADAIVGKANIAKTMAFLDDKNNRLTWAPVGADVSSNDLGYTWGNYEFRSLDRDGVTRVERGKYITVWKKQPDGSWKVAVDMGNLGPKQK